MNYSDACIYTGERVITKSYAKINLTLDVKGKRKDGYHELESVMQTISLFDLLILDKHDEIKVKTNLRFLPNNEKNIAFKAADMFFKASGIKGGARILIHKNIPVGAGLAGGSTNGAAVLTGLNRLYGNPLSMKKLFELGARLGADVPFCMMGGTALAQGIGEKLTPLASAAGINILVVKPKIGVSTQDIFKAYDNANIPERPDNQAMIKAIEDKNIKGICDNVLNVLEFVSAKRYPIIKGIISTMNANGALCSAMTGSGSAVFGIFSNAAKADNCAKLFYPDFDDVYTVITV